MGISVINALFTEATNVRIMNGNCEREAEGKRGKRIVVVPGTGEKRFIS